MKLFVAGDCDILVSMNDTNSGEVTYSSESGASSDYTNGSTYGDENKSNAKAFMLIFFLIASVVFSIFMFSRGGVTIEEHNIFDPETAAPDVE